MVIFTLLVTTVASLRYLIITMIVTQTILLVWIAVRTGYGSFRFPSAIAIQGNVLYVAEGGSHQVQKFTTSGEFVSKFGSQGSGNGQFNQPRGLCVHNDGRVFVSDCGNNHVSIFKADDTFLYHITGI